MKLRKCPQHGYTLETSCPKCKKPSKDAHYKFIKIKDVSEINKK